VSRKRIKRIHVNRQVLGDNLRNDRNNPPITVKETGRNDYGHTVDLVYEGKVIAQILHQPGHPLSCGARVWIETTECDVVVHDEIKNRRTGECVPA